MQLSNSSIGLFCDCPRCFYFEKKLSVPRPRGIFSSLPNGIDRILKNQMNEHRGRLPEIMRCKETEGYVLFDDAALMKKYCHWKSSPLKYTDSKGNVLVGALDELLYNPKTDKYMPADWKTKGSEPDQEYCEKYYQKQLNFYALLCMSGGLKIDDYGILQYFFPSENGKEGLVTFNTKTFVLKTDVIAAMELFRKAILCIESITPPPSSADCEFCRYAFLRHENEASS